MAWGDYDNDGDLDLYLANERAGEQAVPERRRRRVRGRHRRSGPLGDTGDGAGVAWGDYDNDGDLDLYLANYGPANKLFRNDGGRHVRGRDERPAGRRGQGPGRGVG